MFSRQKITKKSAPSPWPPPPARRSRRAVDSPPRGRPSRTFRRSRWEKNCWNVTFDGKMGIWFFGDVWGYFWGEITGNMIFGEYDEILQGMWCWEDGNMICWEYYEILLQGRYIENIWQNGNITFPVYPHLQGRCNIYIFFSPGILFFLQGRYMQNVGTRKSVRIV